MHGVDRAPVELDGAADAVSARTEYHDRFFIVVVRDIVFGTVVSQIKVVGQFGMLRSDSVDALDRRQDTEAFAVVAYGDHLFFEVAIGRFDQTCDLEIRESESLCLAHHVGGNFGDRTVFFQHERVLVDVFEFGEEPRIDFGQLVEFLYAVTFLKSSCNGEHAHIGRIGQFVVEVLEGDVAVADETVHPLPDHTQTFLDDLLETFADRHDFADRFHARSDLARYACELA